MYEVSDDSLAAGILQADDIFVTASLRGETIEITRQYHVIDMMLDARVGDVVTFTLLREGEEKTVSITVTEECLTAY